MNTIIPKDADSYVQAVNENRAPWIGQNWSDSTKEQYFNLLNTQIANEHELEMWHLNNEYNTPYKQMERLVEAGINPAAAYQQISAGNASSAPNVHEAKSASYHDTSDKLNTINTIMSGISQLFGNIGSAVSTASGIQDIALKHQNNWLNQMRAQLASDPNFFDVIIPGSDPRNYSNAYQVAPGMYVEALEAMLYPELYRSFKSDSYNYNLKSLLNERQQGIYEKSTQVYDIMNSLFKELDSSSPDVHNIINSVLKLISLQLLKRY